MEKNSLFQQAKDLVANLTNMQGTAGENEKQAAQKAIDEAYKTASPEEQQQLQQLEQQLKQSNHLS